MNCTYLPPQWLKHKFTLLAWPYNKKLWLNDLILVQIEFINFCKALIDANEFLKILVNNESSIDECKRYLNSPNIEYLNISYDDIWIRDTSPIFTINSKMNVYSNIFKFNGWGNKYLLYNDINLAKKISKYLEYKVIYCDYILEGGSIETNGFGVCLTTEQCLMNNNRNKNRSKKDVEEKLKNFLSLEKFLWLESGLFNDHTDGHIDTLARFISDKRIVCMRAHYKKDPNFYTLKRNANKLKNFTDLSGNKFEIIEIPSPGIVKSDDGEIMPASFINFYIANNAIIMPIFDTVFDYDAVKILSSISENVIPVLAKSILLGGGTLNCITSQVPNGDLSA